jgi:valyl-tRNA synthetase
MKGVIDVDAERARLEKQLEKVSVDLARTNDAPVDVVTKEKQRAADFEKTISQLKEQLEKLADLT